MNLQDAKKNKGRLVRVSDGTPRPPERFNKKLKTWEYSNFSGELGEIRVSRDGSKMTAEIFTSASAFCVSSKWVDLDRVSLI